MYLWKSMLFSHRTCKFGRMSICAAPAWKCIQKHWVHRSSACRLRKPLSKFSIYWSRSICITLYIHMAGSRISRWEHLCLIIPMDWPNSSFQSLPNDQITCGAIKKLFESSSQLTLCVTYRFHCSSDNESACDSFLFY